MHSRNIKYILCVMGSVLLLVIAILGPQLLFSIQDEYQMEKSWQGQRVSLDLEALNSSYGSMRERLISFADGLAQGRDYYVAGTEYQVTGETYTLVDQILGQEIFSFLESWGFPYYSKMLYKIGYSIQDCKKYVIYDDSFDEGQTSVVAMAWYLNLRISENFHIKLLTDTESNALYYIQYVFEENSMEKEEIAYYQDIMTALFAYFHYYYGAGVEKAQSYEEFVEVVDKEVSESILREEYFADGVSVKAKLPFGENGNFLILDAGIGNKHIYMGIMELKELIPELQ